MGPVDRLALYTTVYPGVEPYLREWGRSVAAQTERSAALWIGLDTLSVEAAAAALGDDDLAAHWIVGAPGDSPAQVRQRAFAAIAERFDAVILVDADDVLHPSRVAAAREGLDDCDVVACALRLVDEAGRDLGIRFGLPDGKGIDGILPRTNVFGGSNSAYRSEMLARCLPLPADVSLVDWCLATRAWLCGARMSFDARVGMDYRQHGGNMVRTSPPFDEAQVARDAGRVLRHLEFVLGSPVPGESPARRAELECFAADVDAFQRCVVREPDRLAQYVASLNQVATAPVWWAWVAHPALRHLWTTERQCA